MKREIAALNLEIRKETEGTDIQWRRDRNGYRSQCRQARLESLELAVHQKGFQAARTRFETGAIDADSFAERETALLDKRLKMLQARKDCWDQFLKLVSGLNQPLLELL